MPPVLLPSDPVRTRRLQSAKRSGEFIAVHRGEYLGKFLVVHDGQFVAADEDPDTALARAREMGFDPSECVVQYIPEKDSLWFF